MSTTGYIEPQYLIEIKPVGSKIFLNLLTVSLVPMVYSSILTGVVSLGDLQRLNRIGARTIIYYLITTAIAISIGLLLANIFQPGQGLDASVREAFSGFQSLASEQVATATQNQQSFFQTLQGLIPNNILSSVSGPKPQMLALIFFAILSGLALLQIEESKAKPVTDFFSGITEMTIRLVIMAMRVAPYGVFAIIASTIAQNSSVDLLLKLIPFSLIVLAGLALHGFGTNYISLKFLSGKPYKSTIVKMKEVVVTAFSTSSSGATMPLTLTTTKNELGVSKEVAGFVIPLGATINMDGTALFQGVSALFLANIYGIDLDFTAQLTVIGMAVMASIGTAAVPGVGIVILTMILVSVGIPPEGILFILPVNNILDMFRTAVNVMGDMCCAVYIDTKEGSQS